MTDREIIDTVHDILRESEYTHNALEAKSGIAATVFRAWFCYKYSPYLWSLYLCLAPLKCGITVKGVGNTMNKPSTTDQELVCAVRQAWYDSGLTLEELSARSGIAPSTIGNWFYSGKSPRLVSIVKVAEVCGATLGVTKL